MGFSGTALYGPDSRIEKVSAGRPPECGEGAAGNGTGISVATSKEMRMRFFIFVRGRHLIDWFNVLVTRFVVFSP
jgi:hypothetical protein